jgi:hypothetical protein
VFTRGDYSNVVSFGGLTSLAFVQSFRRIRCSRATPLARPQIAADLQALIRQMSIENWLWGAPHIHGEMLKLGFAVAQSTTSRPETQLLPRPPTAAGYPESPGLETV